MMRYVDLHTHTNHSDATVSPEELVRQAKAVGLSAIAVTDHDTVAGVEPARRAGFEYGVEVIAGVELSTEENGVDMHILGYCLDIHHEELLEKLALFRRVREERAEKIVRRLREMDVHLDLDRVREIAGHGAVGRPHIAQALLEKGYVQTFREAFQKYLGYESPAYVPKYRMRAREAVALIRRAGGVPVVAHPAYYPNTNLILALKEFGLIGIEVWHSDHSPEDVAFWESFADRHGFLKTGGSDYHGAKKNIRLGSLKLPYRLVESLREARRNG